MWMFSGFLRICVHIVHHVGAGRDPKTTLGFTELKICVILMLTVCCIEKIQITRSTEERGIHMQGPGKPGRLRTMALPPPGAT